MTPFILTALGLYLVQTFLPPAFRYYFGPNPDPMATMGARDTPPETSIQGKRSERALVNMGEGLLIFLPLALLLEMKAPAIPDLGILGAQIFVIARALYVPAYIFGIPVVRSVVWIAGLIGLVMMAIPLH